MHKTGLVLDARFLRHDTGFGHPERPARLEAIERALSRKGLIGRCLWVPVREATAENVHRIHQPDYVERLARAARDGAPYIDVPDSVFLRQVDLSVELQILSFYLAKRSGEAGPA